EIQRVVPYLHCPDRLGRLRRQGDDRQFGAAMQHFVVGDFRIAKTDVQADLRISAGECAQQWRQAVQADVMAGRQAQTPAYVAVEVGQGAAGVVQYIQNLISPRQQGSSCLGQANLAAEPVEQ